MTKLTAITDADGKLLGTVRAGPVQAGNTSITFSPHSDFRYQEVEVTDEMLAKPADELHKQVLSKMAGKR